MNSKRKKEITRLSRLKLVLMAATGQLDVSNMTEEQINLATKRLSRVLKRHYMTEKHKHGEESARLLLSSLRSHMRQSLLSGNLGQSEQPSRPSE